MATLKALDAGQQAPVTPEALYTCEICGTQTPASQTYSLAVIYRMPGPGIAGFQCPTEQHFGCSHEHAEQAMLACLEEHIKPIHSALTQHVQRLQHASLPAEDTPAT